MARGNRHAFRSSHDFIGVDPDFPGSGGDEPIVMTIAVSTRDPDNIPYFENKRREPPRVDYRHVDPFGRIGPPVSMGAQRLHSVRTATMRYQASASTFQAAGRSSNCDDRKVGQADGVSNRGSLYVVRRSFESLNASMPSITA